jgi:hypothetical protein
LWYIDIFLFPLVQSVLEHFLVSSNFPDWP